MSISENSTRNRVEIRARLKDENGYSFYEDIGIERGANPEQVLAKKLTELRLRYAEVVVRTYAQR